MKVSLEIYTVFCASSYAFSYYRTVDGEIPLLPSSLCSWIERGTDVPGTACVKNVGLLWPSLYIRRVHLTMLLEFRK